MDDAGAVVISSWEYCFYQTGVDIRNWVLTSWPYKRQWKRETFVHFHHFYLALPSDSLSLRERSFFPFLNWIYWSIKVTWRVYCIVMPQTATCACLIFTCGEVAFCPGLLNLFFFPGLSQPLVWFMTVGQDSGKKRPTKNPGTPWR